MDRKFIRRTFLRTLAVPAIVVATSLAQPALADFPREGSSLTLQWGAGGYSPRFNPPYHHPYGDYHGDNFYDGPSWSDFRIRFDRELQRGASRGLLSRAELRDLADHRRQVERLVASYRADGFLSRYERRQLSDEFASLNSDLEHQLRDGEHARPDSNWPHSSWPQSSWTDNDWPRHNPPRDHDWRDGHWH